MTKMFRVALASVLLAGCSIAEPPNGKTRAGLTTMYKLILAGHDTDGDEKWSRSEVQAMVDMSMPGDARRASNRDEMRAGLDRDFAAQDLDHDGYLDLAELLTEPMATFTCLDADSDGSINQSEIRGRMGRCDPNRERLMSAFHPFQTSVRVRRIADIDYACDTWRMDSQPPIHP